MLFLGFTTFAQHSSNEQFPIFSDCVNATGKQQESCFYNTIQNYFYNNFKVPQELQDQNYKGTVIAVFEVDTTGDFKVLYTDAAHESLKKEAARVFESLPKVLPATYSGKSTYSKFSIKINIPLVAPSTKEDEDTEYAKTNTLLIDNKKELSEYDNLVIKPFENP